MADTPWDSQVWERLGSAGSQLANRLSQFGNIPAQADRIAEERFPDSARDNSRKNAFRHALGTGMMAQQLGGGPIAATAAKLAGYGWEGLGAMYELRDHGQIREHYRSDALHDLNANNVGASLAVNTRNQAELVEALSRLANGSIKGKAPGLFEYGQPRLTHTER